LHLGHGYSALLAQDLAHAQGGRFVLRIEDMISLFIPARVAVGRILAMAAPFVGGWIALQRMAALAP